MYAWLTNKGNGAKLLVNTDQVKMLELDADGVSVHVVFGADMVRTVTESMTTIQSMIGGSEIIFKGKKPTK